MLLYMPKVVFKNNWAVVKNIIMTQLFTAVKIRKYHQLYFDHRDQHFLLFLMLLSKATKMYCHISSSYLSVNLDVKWFVETNKFCMSERMIWTQIKLLSGYEFKNIDLFH